MVKIFFCGRKLPPTAEGGILGFHVIDCESYISTLITFKKAMGRGRGGGGGGGRRAPPPAQSRSSSSVPAPRQSSGKYKRRMCDRLVLVEVPIRFSVAYVVFPARNYISTMNNSLTFPTFVYLFHSILILFSFSPFLFIFSFFRWWWWYALRSWSHNGTGLRIRYWICYGA